jgi:hypothetical protein
MSHSTGFPEQQSISQGGTLPGFGVTSANFRYRRRQKQLESRETIRHSGVGIECMVNDSVPPQILTARLAIEEIKNDIHRAVVMLEVPNLRGICRTGKPRARREARNRGEQKYPALGHGRSTTIL